MYRSKVQGEVKSVTEIIKQYPDLVCRIASREKITEAQAAVLLQGADCKTIREYLR